MYSRCLFCNKDLGRNETFETFSVGRRLAFDAAKGRLWVVCPHCERWNLSPLDERWEAIEHAERLYRDTRRRVATDNIGLAKLRDGTTIVRIGEPMRPEFAAWRYGDQFGRRRKRQILIAGAGLGALGAVLIGGATAGVGIGSIAWLIKRAGKSIIRGSPESVVATIKSPNGEMLAVRRRHLLETSIESAAGAPLAIRLRYKNGSALFEGPQALYVASRVIPAANRFGGSKQDIASAVGAIEQAGSPEAYLERLSHVAAVTTRPREKRSRGMSGVGFLGWGGVQIGRRTGFQNHDWTTGLFALNSVQRLALEMALHEETERAAMQGELAQLEAAWRDAEEIAGIADNLTIPASVNERFEQLRDGDHG